ncbi:MAG: hypothetical protein E7627_03410 [Ruminococcaceae bacterium]|nr:hypothetical protein [Oscillospiraceae bacterium]
MKKTISIILIFVLLISSTISLLSCTDKDVPTPSSNETEEKVGTGFPSGQIQREYIYYDGVVWVYDSYTPNAQKLKVLPDGYTLVGQTLIEDSYEIPSEDFHTAHVEPGRNVYASSLGDALYIELKDGTYYRFVPEKA